MPKETGEIAASENDPDSTSADPTCTKLRGLFSGV